MTLLTTHHSPPSRRAPAPLRPPGHAPMVQAPQRKDAREALQRRRVLLRRVVVAAAAAAPRGGRRPRADQVDKVGRDHHRRDDHGGVRGGGGAVRDRAAVLAVPAVQGPAWVAGRGWQGGKVSGRSRSSASVAFCFCAWLVADLSDHLVPEIPALKMPAS